MSKRLAILGDRKLSRSLTKLDNTPIAHDPRRELLGFCDLESGEFENGVVIHLAHPEFRRHTWLTAAALYTARAYSHTLQR